MNEKQKPTIVFMGTPDFASVILETLILEEYPILAVVTQPDYQSKNKKEDFISPVKKLALEKNIPISQPQKLDENFKEWLADLKPDLTIVAAFGKILPEKILEIPKYKSINVHASILPKLRGASPIQNALVQGLNETGVSIMIMDKGVDTGDILAQKTIAIDPTDDYITLTSKLAVLGSRLLKEIIPQWINKEINPQKQDSSQATMCQLIEKSDGKINWSETATDIYNKSRGFKVWPGIFSFWENKGNLIKISFTEITIGKEKAGEKHHLGEIFITNDSDVAVQTVEGLIIIKKIQMAGKNEMDISDFINGYQNFIGSILK